MLLFFLKNLLIVFLFFIFQDIYSTRLQERYENDPLTHPELDLDLWLEAGSSIRPDKNQVFGILNVTVEDMLMGRSVSTVGSL